MYYAIYLPSNIYLPTNKPPKLSPSFENINELKRWMWDNEQTVFPDYMIIKGEIIFDALTK